MKGNLYVLDTVSENYYCSFFHRRDMSVEDWHAYLGHPSITTMKHMKMLNGRLHTEILRVIESCEVCIKAKQARNSFSILNRVCATL